MNLAFYGTLRDPDILRFIVGEEFKSRFYKIITVKGWACLRIEGEAYPLLRSDPSAATLFHLYHDCSEVSWRRLVAYEGPDYTFRELTIEGISYRIFIADPLVEASSEVWELETFQRRDKDRYRHELEGQGP